MTDAMYYLKPNVIVEPLINNWYAWCYIISPATAAMVLAYSHQAIMASYISSPQMHEIACRHPETAGGPFIDYPIRRVEEIQALQHGAKDIVAPYLAFAAAVKKLHAMLMEHPVGMSLEVLYSQLPEELRGYVELYYDVANRPHFRFFEALLYYGSLNTAPLQSVILSSSQQDYRPFCLSTPRLAY